MEGLSNVSLQTPLACQKPTNESENRNSPRSALIYSFADELPSFYHSDYLPLGIRALDQVMGGGIRKKELGVVLAVYQNGKTAMLTTIAARNYIRGQKVLHFVFEDHIADIYQMHTQIVADKKLDKIAIDGIGGRLWLVDATSELTPLEQVERVIEKYLPDVCIFDYAQEIPMGSAVKSWKELQEIVRALRRLANKYNCAIWTGWQVNEAFYSDGTPIKEINTSRISECKSIITIADIVFGLTRQEQNDRVLVSVLKAKHRRQEEGKKLPLYFNLGVDFGTPKFWSLK